MHARTREPVWLALCHSESAVHHAATKLSPERVSKTFARLVSRSTLRPVRLHDLRHGAASMLLASGADLALVSKMLGHSGLNITADTYAHLGWGSELLRLPTR